MEQGDNYLAHKEKKYIYCFTCNTHPFSTILTTSLPVPDSAVQFKGRIVYPSEIINISFSKFIDRWWFDVLHPFQHFLNHVETKAQ